MQRSTIEWINPVPDVGFTWGPTSGCSQAGDDCANCYAQRQAGRFMGPGQNWHGLISITRKGDRRWNGKMRLEADRLDDPIRRRTPAMIFVNSMSDLYHPGLTDGQIDQVMVSMLLSPWHRYVTLTKRHLRLAEYTTSRALYGRLLAIAQGLRASSPRAQVFYSVGIEDPLVRPPPWIYQGISAGRQDYLDERIVGLLRSNVAVKVLSLEPLIGPISIAKWLIPHTHVVIEPRYGYKYETGCPACIVRREIGAPSSSTIDWVITGAESGPARRPCEVDWIRQLRDECAAGGVPFFFKQWTGDLVDGITAPSGHAKHAKLGLPVLDGTSWAMFPKVHATEPW